MVEKIKHQIESINQALDWIKKNKSEHYEQRFMQLIEERRKMRKILLAEEENPGIAAFGKSQVGKSYLMSSILQNEGQPFMVKANGRTYNFIDEMNPITDNTEATGVVTRFSSYKRHPKRYMPEYPIIMKTLSPADIITILSDGYFNDIEDYTSDSENEINSIADTFYEKYKNMPVVAGMPLLPDDVLNIKNYFKLHINNAQAFNRSYFFDRIALVATKIPVTDWVDVFQILWNRNARMSQMFSKTIVTLRNLDFASDVYLPVEAVLHQEIKPNTIMSVDCLKEMFIDAPNYFTDAYLRQGDGFKKVAHLTKSEVCAVCSEVIFKIEQDFLTSTSSYKLDDIPYDTQAKLTKGEIKMSILEDNDLLDFPGARSREKEKASSLDADKVLINVFLRGKVAYLFNKYNEASAINVLLFCHDQVQNDVTNLYILLDEWVRNYVGDTPQKRQEVVSSLGGIAPLFYIGTKFNMDLAMRTGTTANSTTAIDGRWEDRFDKVLYKQCFHPDTALWVTNWTAPGTRFKNSYLLRDFRYSGPKASKLYKGFEENGTESPRVSPNMPDGTNSEGYVTDSYYEQMRTSFINSPAAQMLFDDTKMAWDVAASRNNDGSLHVIEKLSAIANRLEKTREMQFEQQMGTCRSKLLSILNEYHVSEDVDEILKENICKANSVMREMDFTCNDDNYFFGHLLQAIQVTEKDCLQIVHALIQSGELGEKNNNFADYAIILKRCNNFSGCQNNEECWKKLMSMYGLRTKEDAANYLASRDIDPKVLFSGTFKKRLNSVVIADKVYTLWQDRIKSVEMMNKILDNQSFDALVMSSLLDNIIETSHALKLDESMSNSIADYVNIINIYTVNESLIADILSSIINSFVIDLGYSMLRDSDKQDARRIAQQYDLNIFHYIDKERKSHFEEEELTALFDDLSTNPKALTTAFENNYYTWLEYMYVSFIAHLDVPEYDHQANDELTTIINSIAS